MVDSQVKVGEKPFCKLDGHLRLCFKHSSMLLVYVFLKDSNEAGPLESLRSQICDNVAMYAQKYDEEFQVQYTNSVY